MKNKKNSTKNKKNLRDGPQPDNEKQEILVSGYQLTGQNRKKTRKTIHKQEKLKQKQKT